MTSFKVISLCFVATLVRGEDYSGASLGDAYTAKTGLGLSTGIGHGPGLLSSTGLLGSGLSNGYGLGLPSGLGGGYSPVLLSGLAGPGHTTAAIQSRRTFEVLPLALPQDPVIPQVVDVEPSVQPVQIIFRSISSPVLVQQIHTPGVPGQVEATRSEDEPHRVLHEVMRPVIQEVREVIQPYRRVVQEVRPVLEEVHTLVAKGDGLRRGAARGYGGEGLAYGKGGHYKKAARAAAAKAARAARA